MKITLHCTTCQVSYVILGLKKRVKVIRHPICMICHRELKEIYRQPEKEKK